jgi:ankyrin repeat protein
MLSQMADTFDVLYQGRSIDIQHLDITSYLSAPNRINTCSKHLGTVYRIFADLSKMRWWEKYTALYSLATHSIDKIVEVFDPETGQVLKDQNDQLKIQTVIDWPTTGFRRGKEYKSFFKQAKNLNNYHPQITEKMFQIKRYHPLRYQTKKYDEGVCSLSVFSQEEQQFLESYRWLRRLPEFFEPKEIFSVTKDKQAQEEADKILQSYKLENDTINCTDARSLQALIPYVKRLLQLFPQIKGNTTGVLTPQEIRNNVYQFVTKRYLKKFQQSPLDFDTETSSLKDFLNNDFLNNEERRVLQLRMVHGDAWTGLIKVYQVLKKTPSMTPRLSEGQYTILTLEHLLTVNQMVNLNTLIESTSTHLLMVSCNSSQPHNDEDKQTFQIIFNTLKQKSSVKMIFTTRSTDATVNFLQDIAKETLSTGFVTRDEQLTWSDITTGLQLILLEKTVNFQGSKIALNKLISADSPVTKCLPLLHLLGEEYLMIGGEPVSNSNCNYYNEKYYIDRIFHHQVAIEQNILDDEMREKFSELLASTEEEFKQLCQENPKRNVHWLTRKPGELFWQQSQGSVEKLRKYIRTHISHKYAPNDLDRFLEQAERQRVILISDTAGMGKSTVLTHLSKQIKQRFPAKLVVRIDLNDYTDELDELKTLEKEQIDKEKAIEFVSDKLLKLKPGLEMELFKQCCEQKQKVRIVIMLDGFDEISPSYKDIVLDLLQALRQTEVEQLWVTTRPHLRHKLEDNLQQFSYTMEPFSEKNQVEFLTKFWSLQNWFTKLENEDVEANKRKLETYAQNLIKKLAQSISDKDREFTGIPLQSRMLAEAFDEEVKTFCQSDEAVPELQFKLDLFGLYKRFIRRKYDIYQEEKSKAKVSNVTEIRRRDRELEFMRNDHQLLALKVLFTEEELALLQIHRECTFEDEDLNLIGIVQVSYEGKPHFIHRTFAEYYVADFLVHQLTNSSNTPQQVQDLILQKIFLEKYYRVIRVFMDGFLSTPTKEILKQYGNWIYDLRTDYVHILHTAAREGNRNIVGFLLDSLQEAEHTDTVKEFLLAQDHYGRTAWHLAAEWGNTVLLQKLWEWAKQTLTREEIKSKLLLGEIQNKKTAWKIVTRRRYIQAIEKLWEWGKEVLTTEELKNDFFFAKGVDRRTAWQDAAMQGNTGLLQTLWDGVEKEITPEEFSKKLLLAVDKTGTTVWHNAAERGDIELLKRLWGWAGEKLTPGMLKNQVLLGKSSWKENVWHVAAEAGNIQVMEKLWEWANEKLSPDELNNKLLLGKDHKKRTAWHVAAEAGNIQLLEKLWQWAKQKLNPQKLKNEVLFVKVHDKKSAWDVAVHQGNKEVFGKLLEWAKQELTQAELNNRDLFFKKRLDALNQVISTP